MLTSLVYKGKPVGDPRYENRSYFVAILSHRCLHAKIAFDLHWGTLDEKIKAISLLNLAISSWTGKRDQESTAIKLRPKEAD